MPKWLSIVEVEADTIEQARIVMNERVNFDEPLKDEEGQEFDYMIWLADGPIEAVSYDPHGDQKHRVYEEN